MWAVLKKVATDCTTENDGKSFCAFRLAGCSIVGLGLPTLIGCTVYAVMRTHAFDMTAFGTAIAAMLSGTAMLSGGVALKARGEDHEDSDH